MNDENSNPNVEENEVAADDAPAATVSDESTTEEQCDGDAPDAPEESGPVNVEEFDPQDDFYFFQKAFFNILVRMQKEYTLTCGMYVQYICRYGKYVPKKFKDYVKSCEEEHEKILKDSGKDNWFSTSYYITVV